MNINNMLKNLRKGATQKATAEKIGIPYANYNKYETTNTTPDLESLIKIADYYHITVDNLIGHEVPYMIDKSQFSTEQKELLDEIKNLSPDNCKRVKDFITGILIAEEEKQRIINLYKRGE